MSCPLNDDDRQAVGDVLSGRFIVQPTPRVTVVGAPLPGRVPAALACQDGHLTVVVDVDKPGAHRHARALIDDWQVQQLAPLRSGDDDLDAAWARGVGIPEPHPEQPRTVLTLDPVVG